MDRSPVPDSGSEMELIHHGDDFYIQVDGHLLMSSRLHGSEDALAELAFDRLDRPASKVLVGGLGMGFTVAAALRRSPPDSRVTVAELVPAVVRWNRGPLGDAAGRPLDDSRLKVHEGNVIDLVRCSRAPWDVILLDVDNGPNALSSPTNGWLYEPAGLKALLESLELGGLLGIWSANPDPRFTRRMQAVGFTVEVVPVRARGKRGGARHTVWLGRRLRAARRTRPRRTGRPENHA